MTAFKTPFDLSAQRGMSCADEIGFEPLTSK
jgi:hypothetical protein